MKTLLRFCFAVFIVLFCISALGVITGIFAPAVRVSQGIVQPMVHTVESVAVTPVRAITAMPAIVLIMVSIFLVALVLRWAFGGLRHEPRGESRPDAGSVGDVDLHELARDLQYTARRMEERLDALETILLERTRSRL